MDLGKLTQKQLIVLSIFYVFGTLFISLPRILSEQSLHTGWLSILLAMVLFAGYSVVFGKVLQNQGEKDFIAYLHGLFGKRLGPVLTLLLFLLPTLLYSAFVVRLVIELFVTLILPETPLEAMLVLVLLLRYWMVSGGVAAIGLFAEIILPMALVILSLIFFMSGNKVDLSRITPLFDSGMSGLLRGSMAVYSSYLEIGILLYAANRIRNPKHTVRSLHIVNGTVGVLFLSVYWLCLGNFGVAFSSRLSFPTIEMVRNISLFNFIEHIESVFLAVFVFVNLTKGALTMYACCVGLQSWFKLESYRPLMLPISIIIFYLALLPQNLLQAVFRFEQFKALTYPVYGTVTILVLYGLARLKASRSSGGGSP
ncbi:GerAB/ArcD/ProY family transporter [Gorillibacterium sp. sgz5001074]|uniref:GerAB/ArcD/ProY family transporter n=1 Tax=Gorillibacterium sp. sgz5001074 TaxID=3446695 RepID=UPI003F669B64